MHRFLAGEIAAQEAIARIREDPDVRDDDPSPEPPSAPWIDRVSAMFPASFRTLFSE
ncbi:hypothetical protein [Candidatus Rariloculus sp.]|uniref:hypothetical protein n=1 Tax=Candidatus Rariloculus sp. TaxID=3101265 RepID=UPI003D0FB27F